MILERDLDAIQNNLVRGTLYVDGQFFSATVENLTCMIPELIYPVSVTHSPRFGRPLPLIQCVPRTKDHPELGLRSGIRIHRGCRAEHSAGCVLLPAKERVEALTALLTDIQLSGEDIRLEVRHIEQTYPLYDVPCPPDEVAVD